MNDVYFSLFSEDEITGYLLHNGFRIDCFDTRQPYDLEIEVDRIYVIATKL